MDVFIDKTEDKIWQGNSLPENDMLLIIGECFNKTKTTAKSVFLNVNFMEYRFLEIKT